MRTVIDWVAAKTLWVDPEVVARVQVVFPKTRRKHHDEKRGEVIGGIRIGTNVPPQHAFWYARGEDGKDYVRPYVCHLYEGSPYLPEHNTNLANLCVFPRGIQSLSEWAPIQEVLHWHAWTLYGYSGPRDEAPSRPRYYPSQWPGVARHSSQELAAIVARLEHLRSTRPMHTNPAGSMVTQAGAIQTAALDALREAPHGLTQAEIANLIGRKGPQANQVLSKLVERGLVRREEDPRRPNRYLYFAVESPNLDED